MHYGIKTPARQVAPCIGTEVNVSYEPRGWREPEHLGTRIVTRTVKRMALLWLGWAVIAMALGLSSLRRFIGILDSAFGR